jgi:Recombination endonuclease VII
LKTPRKPSTAIQLSLSLENQTARPFSGAHKNNASYLERRAMEAQQIKRCSVCKTVKTYSEFDRRRPLSGSHGPKFIGSVANTCKDCTLTYKRDNYMRRKYGISLEEYASMYQAQEGCCTICHTPGKSAAAEMSDHSRHGSHAGVLVVDHDHVTGKVRALLCPSCNLALGALRDDTELFRKAIMYLEAHGDPDISYKMPEA